MAELEQQVAEHNILQREIEAYGQQLRTLVGPVGASLSNLVWTPPFLPSQSGYLALKGRVKGERGCWWGSACMRRAISLNPVSLFG